MRMIKNGAILIYKNDTDDHKYGKPIATFLGNNINQIINNIK